MKNLVRSWAIAMVKFTLLSSVVAVTMFAQNAKDSTSKLVQDVRAATQQYLNVNNATAAGYGPAFGCVSGSDHGAMGIHYLNPSLVPELFDSTATASVDAATPELLVYAPDSSGGPKRLVALEYLTIKGPWDAQHNGVAPSLFGQTFNETDAGNRFGLPAFYSLHAWIWDPNPTDLFAPWNPRVSCP